MIAGWLLSQSLTSQAAYLHNHKDQIPAAEYQKLLAENAQLTSEVAKLEAAGTPRDVNYKPDLDLDAAAVEDDEDASLVLWFFGLLGVGVLGYGAYHVFRGSKN
jgi:hypothetical protein